VDASADVARIVWQRLDVVGAEWCEVARTPEGIRIEGVALVGIDGDGHRIDYHLALDAAGRTRSVRIGARAGDHRSLELDADGEGGWRVDGVVLDVGARGGDASPPVLDVDLGFSPLTNSLPVWRFGPDTPVGSEQTIRVAWVLYPSLEVLVGTQSYTRLRERSWRYRSTGFVADLELDTDGLVDTYAGYWRAIGRS